MTRGAVTVVLCALVRLGSPLARADEPREALRGVVEDPRGAPVRSAEVEAEGAAARTATGEDGTFTIALPPGFARSACALLASRKRPARSPSPSRSSW